MTTIHDYRIRNYKGNLLESIRKFQKKIENVKIIGIKESGNELKIKAKQLNEDNDSTSWKKMQIYILDLVSTAATFDIVDNDGTNRNLKKLLNLDKSKKEKILAMLSDKGMSDKYPDFESYLKKQVERALQDPLEYVKKTKKRVPFFY